MLVALMLCYLFFYTGRQNFGWVMKSLNEELGISPARLGLISGAMLACYGIGQAINGNLGDRFGARRMVTLGAIGSFVLNWVTSFGHSFWTLLLPWAANGYFQSLAWAPGSRLLSNWFARAERGRAFGFYVFAAGFSSVLTFVAAILVLDRFSWEWVFRLPVILLLGAGIVFFLLARDRPEDLGFEPLSDEAGDEGSITHQDVMRRYAHALTNWRFLVASVSIGFESLARYGLLIWVPYHYLGDDWKGQPGSVWITLALPLGMAFGALSSGYISDRLFQANRSRPIALLLLLAAGVTLTMSVVPREHYLIGLCLLFVAGFLVYGPQSAFWALCPDLLGRQHAGTGVGLMNAFAYAFAAVGEPMIGLTIERTGNTASVFGVTAVVCLLGAICIVPVRR
ncbi:MAG: MFS transporter [Luteitalea sp.]|nr:MFS transporter [Luteitalea sp.]